MSTSQLTIPLQKLIAAGNEFQQFVVRNLLMDIPSAENVRIVSESIISDKNRALQTASLRALKTKYLDYKSTEPEHRHHTKIVEELNRRKDLNEKIDKSKLDKQILIKKDMRSSFGGRFIERFFRSLK